MYINLIDSNGNEETMFNVYSEEFKKKAFRKQKELNKIGIRICESYNLKPIKAIPDKLYNKAISIIYK